MTERAFVLVPLLELSPAIEIPGAGRAADYLAGVQNQRIEKISSCKCTRLQEGGTPA